MIKVGYPKYIAQENGNFDNFHAWTYGLYVDESYTLLRCPWHGDGCGIRISQGLFKCTTIDKLFNADLAARNILLTPVTPSPGRGRGNGRRPGPGLNPQKGGCSPNLPTPSRGRRSVS
jgi:putative transposase